MSDEGQTNLAYGMKKNKTKHLSKATFIRNSTGDSFPVLDHDD